MEQWHDAAALKQAGNRSVQELVGLSYEVLEEAGKECGLYFEGVSIHEKHGLWNLVYKAPASSELVNLQLGEAVLQAPAADQARILSNLLMSRCLDLGVSLPGF